MGYDGLSNELSVTASSSEIVVTSPAYTLVFDEAHAWLPISWVDHTTDSETELAGSSVRSVLQAPFVAQYGGTSYTLDAFDFADRAIYELDEDRILFRVVYGWVTPDDSEIEAIATHEVFRDGTWIVTAQLENKNDVGKQIGVTYAPTSLSSMGAWRESQLGDAITLDASTGAQLTIDPDDGLPGTLTSDGMGNVQYDVGLVDLGAYDTFDASWTNHLVP